MAVVLAAEVVAVVRELVEVVAEVVEVQAPLQVAGRELERHSGQT